MFSPQRMTKPSPLSYTTPNGSPSKHFRQGSVQYTQLQSAFTSPRGNNNDTNTNHDSNIATVQRSTSAGLTQLTQPQIQEFRESFQILDQDGDGVIGRDDLSAMLNSLGQDPSPALLNQYFSAVPHPFSLASYLTTLTSHLSNLAPRDDLLAAFAAFDETDDGTVDLSLLKDALAGMGMSGDDVDRATKTFSSRKGLGQGSTEKFRYKEFVDMIAGKPLEGSH